MACPVCASDVPIGSVRSTPYGYEGHYVDCRKCGPYFGTEEAVEDLPGTLSGDPELIARVGYGVRRMQRPNRPPLLTTDLIQRFIKTPLPSVFEQANNLIVWLGSNGKGPGETEWIEPRTHQFVIGSKTGQGFGLVVAHLFDTGYIAGNQSQAIGEPGRAHATLSFSGWDHFYKLQAGQTESRNAFMAMKFGDAALDAIVDDFFRPAVAKTGFVLTRLDDQPKAGLIDDRLRVEIRKARFLIADLTHDNLGAYWEAGFAEGLGKPVIYTCQRAKFDQAKTHFDTNHHLTVIWDAAEPAQACNDLMATIRATLPDEANLIG
jgi:hypothetical protein